LLFCLASKQSTMPSKKYHGSRTLSVIM